VRIVLIGQAEFGNLVLRRLAEEGFDVVAAYVPDEGTSEKVDPLKAAAVELSIPFFSPKSYKHDQTHAEFLNLMPDLVVLAFVSDIIPDKYFQAATHGAICYHPSLLPRHRGASAINWALIMGDEKTGLTIFWPVAGIDTGPILYQVEVAISLEDTVGSLYYDHLLPKGIDAIAKSIHLIAEGKAPKVPQLEEFATYEPPCDDRFAQIDWQLQGQEIFNLVRGCDPQPGAYSFWNDQKIRLYGTRLIPGPSDTPTGEILSMDPVFEIAVPGGRLEVGRVRIGSGKKLTISEFVTQSGMAVGDSFSSVQ
jgi:methionyl-tRNA formyltransferase